MNKKVLTVYCLNGAALRFEDVEDVKLFHDGDELAFSYVSMSRPGRIATATFTRSNIAGYSVDS